MADGVYRTLFSPREQYQAAAFDYLHPVHVAECFSTGGSSLRIRDMASDIMKFEGRDV